MKNVLKNILIWFLFSLIISLVPIIATVILISSNDPIRNNIEDIIKDVISHGEIYLITISTLGITLGELFRENSKWPIFHILVGGGSVIALFFAIIIFTGISINNIMHLQQIKPWDKEFIFHSSGYLLGISIFFALSSFIMPKSVQDKNDFKG